MTFLRYPAYKDSGVAWLGEIPAHWDAIRLKHTANIINERLDAKPEDSIYLGLENIETQTGRLLIEATAEQVESVVGVFQAGDVLFGKLRPYLAKVVLPDFSGVCTTELLAIRPSQRGYGRFLLYQLLSKPTINLIDSYTYGSKMPRVNAEQISNTVFTLPPIEEQHTIAAFLDAETARIDTLVAKQVSLITTLQEKRRALISHVVTKGLDPAAPMKDSGVPWLGEVPKHWEILKTRRITIEHKQGYYTEQSYIDEGVKLIRITDIDDSANINFGNMPFVQVTPDSEDAFSVGQGDFLFARSGTIGRFGIVQYPERSVFASYLIRFRFNAYTEFLRYSFKSQAFQEGLLRLLHGGANHNVHAEDIKEQYITLPPISEQTAIADYLDQETAQIDTLITKAQEMIAVLREHRTALVAAAVTGQIDVRRL